MEYKKHPRQPILMVDDEKAILEGQEAVLNSEGINNLIALSDGREVPGILEHQSVEAVLLDLKMPHTSGKDILEHISEHYPEVPVIVVTGNDDISTAVECMKLGAFDFLVKAVEKNRLLGSVRRAIDYRRLRREHRELKETFFRAPNWGISAFSEIVTRDGFMEQLFAYAELIADSPEPVLITGETGVGKELMARAIHKAGGWSGAFVAVNAAGLDEQTFSDTLFGHKKGAYTDARESRQGLIRQAEGGTLLLDEIGDLPPGAQVKLLRLIDNGEYYTLGSDLPRKSGARIIAVTNRDLPVLLSEGQFRKDLYYRLETHALHIPPLRERLDDLPLLIRHFISCKNENLVSEMCDLLENYNFPGNIRELRSLVLDSERRAKMGQGLTPCLTERRGTQHVNIGKDAEVSELLGKVNVLPSLKAFKEALIKEALKRADGNQSAAAKTLGISKQALSKRLRGTAGDGGDD